MLNESPTNSSKNEKFTDLKGIILGILAAAIILIGIFVIFNSVNLAPITPGQPNKNENTTNPFISPLENCNVTYEHHPLLDSISSNDDITAGVFKGTLTKITKPSEKNIDLEVTSFNKQESHTFHIQKETVKAYDATKATNLTLDQLTENKHIQITFNCNKKTNNQFKIISVSIIE